MQRGMLDECRHQGFELVIHPCDTSAPDLIDEIYSMLDRSQMGGLILAPPASEMPEVLAALEKRKINRVSIISGSEAPEAQRPCVYIDDREAAYRITRHLLDLGHRKIAFLGGDEAHKSSAEREAGYHQALKEERIDSPPQWVLPGEFSFASGVDRSKHLLTLEDRPTAVFACNDEIAAGTLFAARLSGLEVPGDLSIAGFEDSPFSRQSWPNLTTAGQPITEIARRATALLIDQMRADKGQTKAPESLGFHPELIVRDSTAPPPGNG